MFGVMATLLRDTVSRGGEKGGTGALTYLVGAPAGGGLRVQGAPRLNPPVSVRHLFLKGRPSASPQLGEPTPPQCSGCLPVLPAA